MRLELLTVPLLESSSATEDDWIVAELDADRLTFGRWLLATAADVSMSLKAEPGGTVHVSYTVPRPSGTIAVPASRLYALAARESSAAANNPAGDLLVRRVVATPVGPALRRLAGQPDLPWLGQDEHHTESAYLVPCVAALSFASSRSRWRQTFWTLAHGGEVEFRVKRRSFPWLEAAWRKEIVRRLEPDWATLPDERVQRNLRVQRDLAEDGGYSVEVHVRASNTQTLANAVMADLDGRLLDRLPSPLRMPQWMDDAARAWSYHEVVDLLSPPFSLDNALPGARHRTPSPFRRSARPPAATGPTVSIGHDVEEQPETVVAIAVEDLKQHCLVAGSSGWGKTETTLGIVRQVIRSGIPVLILDPVTSAYDDLETLTEQPVEVIDFTPSRTLSFNPFHPPVGVSFRDHASLLAQIFTLWSPTNAVAANVWATIVPRFYTKRFTPLRMREPMRHSQGDDVPRFEDFLKDQEWLMNSLDSGANTEWTRNTRDHFHREFERLKEGRAGDVFRSDRSLGSMGLFKKNVVVKLSQILEPQECSAVVAMLLAFFSEARMAEGGRDQPLLHLMVVEEAHRVMPSNPRHWDTNHGPSPAERLGETLAQQLAELRNRGQGILLVEQSPLELKRAALVNTSTKILHRLADGSDQKRLQESLGLTDAGRRHLGRLAIGEAVVSTPQSPEPRTVRMLDRHGRRACAPDL